MCVKSDSAFQSSNFFSTSDNVFFFSGFYDRYSIMNKNIELLGGLQWIAITCANLCPSEGKSGMTLLTMARYEWFEEWEGTKLGKRGQDYLDLKNSMAQELLEWALTVFPHLRDKVWIKYLLLNACVLVDLYMYLQYSISVILTLESPVAK